MRVKIKEDLINIIDDYFNGEEGLKKNPEFLKLAERIAGKEVELKFIGGDAFEAEDNNYWLPDCCWDMIPIFCANCGKEISEDYYKCDICGEYFCIDCITIILVGKFCKRCETKYSEIIDKLIDVYLVWNNKKLNADKEYEEKSFKLIDKMKQEENK